MLSSPAPSILVHPHPIERAAVGSWLCGQSSVELIATMPDLRSVEQLTYLAEIELIILFAYTTDSLAAQIIHLKRGNPLIRFLTLAARELCGATNDLIKVGVSGVIDMDSEIDEWERAISTVNKGQVYYSQPVMLRLVNHVCIGIEPITMIGKNVLSTRETEILVMIANEYSTPEISSELCISSKTVETHRRNLFQKLSVKNVVGLTKAAVRLGLV